MVDQEHGFPEMIIDFRFRIEDMFSQHIREFKLIEKLIFMLILRSTPLLKTS